MKSRTIHTFVEEKEKEKRIVQKENKCRQRLINTLFYFILNSFSFTQYTSLNSAISSSRQNTTQTNRATDHMNMCPPYKYVYTRTLPIRQWGRTLYKQLQQQTVWTCALHTSTCILVHCQSDNGAEHYTNNSSNIQCEHVASIQLVLVYLYTAKLSLICCLASDDMKQKERQQTAKHYKNFFF